MMAQPLSLVRSKEVWASENYIACLPSAEIARSLALPLMAISSLVRPRHRKRSAAQRRFVRTAAYHVHHAFKNSVQHVKRD
jgi:hypothetical protein